MQGFCVRCSSTRENPEYEKRCLEAEEKARTIQRQKADKAVGDAWERDQGFEVRDWRKP